MTELNHRKQYLDLSFVPQDTTSVSDDFENKTYDEVDTSTNVSFGGYDNISIDENEKEKISIYQAIEEGYDSEEIAHLLIDEGTDVNYQDHEGNTPLHYAFDSGHSNIQKYLINKGANTNLQNIDGNTPLDIHNTKRKLEEEILKSASFNNSAQKLKIVPKKQVYYLPTLLKSRLRKTL